MLKGENYLRDLIKYALNLCHDACEVISFKFVTVLDTTKLYSMIPV